MDRKLSVTQKLSSGVNDDDQFDQVMEKVGYTGKFQLRFNFVFNFILVAMVSMPYLNIILALAVPDHWCHVPGRDNTSYTLDEWKNLTLPNEYDIKGKVSSSKCKMYNISLDNLSSREFNATEDIISCQYGWDFDRTWYKETVPSQGAWVCEKELFVSNVFAFGRIGDVVGTCIFGQLGDILGRQPVFYITLTILIVGRTLSAFAVDNYSLFLFATVIGSLPSTAVFQAPLIVAMEISEESRRAHIAMMQCVGWTIGMCTMPFILWAFGHWFHFVLTTTLPCIVFFFSSGWMIESPRWLAGRGKTARCIRELERVAKVNGTKVPADALILLSKRKNGQTEKAFGMLSLFSSWRLAKNTVLLLVSWVNGAIIYYVIILNISSLEGNPFMNFFWQGLAELPAYIMARYCCDIIGRRWTQVILNLIGCVGFIAMAILITEPGMETVITLLSSFVKFSISFVFYATNLQTLEIYPTCARQSGLSLCIIFACAFGVFGPYIVYLGTAYNASYPQIVLALLSIFGALSAAFLPETLHEKLPESLRDAQIFGANQKFWSWPHKKVQHAEHL